MTSDHLEVVPLDHVPAITPGDDLVAALLGALEASGHTLIEGDIITVTSKIVSKSEGRILQATDREQAITDESVEVLATRGTTRITRTVHGLVMAAAGVDASNTDPGTVLLLPLDPDASARALRRGVQQATGLGLGVIITDTAGRPWRDGLVDIAIGAAGIEVLDDHRGRFDTQGRPLEMTVTCVADQIAAAAELVKGKAAGRPFAVVRGMAHTITQADGPGASSIVRPLADDLFRRGAQEAYDSGRRDAIEGRRTIRQWTAEAVDHNAVLNAVAAAATAPAPHHTTPWRFVLVTDAAQRSLLLDAMAQQWRSDLTHDGLDAQAIAQRLARGDLLRQAPALVIPALVTTGAHSYPDPQRRQAEHSMFVLSMGAAVEAFMVQLSTEGWGSAWISSTLFCPDVVRETLGWPPDWEPMGAIGIGRPSSPPAQREPRDPHTFLVTN